MGAEIPSPGGGPGERETVPQLNDPVDFKTLDKPRIVAGIPAYNEELSIARVVIETARFVDKVIVVDDGSTDMTAQIAERLGALVLRHGRNIGKGAAVASVFKEARELGVDILVTLDADGQHDPNEIPHLIHPILEGLADVVIGSRRTRPDSMPRLRRLAQRVLDVVAQVTDESGSVVDSQSGFRAYAKCAIDRVSSYEWAMGAETEILKKAFEAGMQIKQVPVDIKYSRKRRTHKMNPVVHFSDVLSAIVMMSIIRRPIRFLGIPAVALVALGLYGWLEVVSRYSMSGDLALGHALVYSMILLAGFFLGVGAIIVLAIRLVVQEDSRWATRPSTRQS